MEEEEHKTKEQQKHCSEQLTKGAAINSLGVHKKKLIEPYHTLARIGKEKKTFPLTLCDVYHRK